MSAIVSSVAVSSTTPTSAAGPAAVVVASSSAPAGPTGFSTVIVPSSSSAAPSSSVVVSSVVASSSDSSASSLGAPAPVAVSAAAASAIPSSNSSATTGTTATAASSTMSAGTIGGIIGGVVGGLALITLAVFLWKKWRSRAERERYPLPPPRSLMSHRPSSVPGSAMLGNEPRRMSSGNLLMASSASRQSFVQPSSSGFPSRRESTYSTLAPPRPYYSGPSGSVSGSQSPLGPTPDSSEAASRTSIDLSASSSAGPSAGQSPELSVADGWLATNIDLPGLPPVAGSSNDTGRSSPSASSSAGHGAESGSSSSRSSSSAAAVAAAAGLPVPPTPMSPVGGQPRHQLRISTSSLGPSHQQYRREPSTARYSISSLSSARSFGQGGSLPSAGGAKASGTPHGGRRVELTMPTPLGPSDEWGMPDSRQYSPATPAGGRYSQRGSTTPRVGAETSTRSDEHDRLQ